MKIIKLHKKSTKYIFTLLCLIYAMASNFVCVQAENALSAKPNFIILFMDDMGYGDITPYGSKLNSTPNLDRMAKEGVRLTNFYSAPLCSASRAQLLTGCYAKRVSMPDVLMAASPMGLSPDEKTIASLLKPQGYSTMCIGKWHLGDQPVYLPLNHGFDHYLGLPYSNNMDGDGKAGKNGKSVPPIPLIQDKKVIEAPADCNRLMKLYTETGVKFIRDNKDKPFFLYMPYIAVHHPLQPGKEFVGKSKNGAYGDWLCETDWSVGTVLDTLKELGLDKNTMVIYTSDNGSVCKDGGSNGPLRGTKFTTWEGGMRTPAIFWWPDKIPAGVTNDALLSEVDIMPTIVKLAGAEIPAERKIDGKDAWALISGKSKDSPREEIYYWLWGNLQGVRVGSWKMVIDSQKLGHESEEGGGGGDGDGKKKKAKGSEGGGKEKSEMFASREKPRLYNLVEDIGETTDVAAQHPEIIKQLDTYIAKMDGDLGIEKAKKSSPPPGVRVHAKVENPKPLLKIDKEYD